MGATHPENRDKVESQCQGSEKNEGSQAVQQILHTVQKTDHDTAPGRVIESY